MGDKVVIIVGADGSNSWVRKRFFNDEVHDHDHLTYALGIYYEVCLRVLVLWVDIAALLACTLHICADGPADIISGSQPCLNRNTDENPYQ